MKTFLEWMEWMEGMERGEGYNEAGELMSQPVPEIMSFLQSIGVPHKPPGSQWSDEDNNHAIRLGQAIDRIQSNATLQPNQIVGLKNLANKAGQEQLPQQLAQISGQPDAGQKYAELMRKRDAGEGRDRGYDVAGLVEKVKKGAYSPPILIKGSSGLVVVGGRTRLYAALALGTPIKVKILDEASLKGAGTQQQAPSTIRGGSPAVASAK